MGLFDKVAYTIFFVISDSLIVINRFLTPVPLSGFLVMSTYYLAQFLITFGVCRQRGRRPHDTM